MKIYSRKTAVIIRGRVTVERGHWMQSFAQWYVRCISVLKPRKAGEARDMSGIHSRIGPVQTSLRPKANRSIHEKHERKVKGTQVGTGGSQVAMRGSGRFPVEASRPSITG